MRNIKKIDARKPLHAKKKRVAAYARVSMQTERLAHSLSAQVSYYSDMIQKNPEWEYAGVYTDDFVSATGTAGRKGFLNLIKDCEEGKIDIILTKSISRFARNTLDLLETVRSLKSIGVEIWFEKEGIHTLDGDGELMLTILASFAQEESESISNNVKWGIRKRFEKGIPNGRFQIYGYRWDGDHLVVEPEEAKVVRLIYDNFMAGLSAEATEKQLEDMGVKSFKGMHFGNTSIRQILRNITYTGNLLFQKEFVSDPITGKSKINRGELPQYFVEKTHEAIIPMELYEAVQAERKRRRELGVFANWSIDTSCFTSRIKCSVCGRSYRRSGKKQRKDPDEVYYTWICRTKSEKGAKFCAAKSVPEKTLKRICTEVLGTEEFDGIIFTEKVSRITVIGEDLLRFHFSDGTELDKKWKSTAKTDWWTKERREAWGELKKSRDMNPNRHRFHKFTGYIKCERCGGNYRCQVSKRKDGTEIKSWFCGGRCGNITIRDDVLKDMVCEILDMNVFSEERMHDALEKITVEGNAVTFHSTDGRKETREYIRPMKKGTKHTEAYKEHMRRLMKERWTDEHRAEMSRKMKHLRKERGAQWRKS